MACDLCLGTGFVHETRDGREWAVACGCRTRRNRSDVHGSVEACRIPARHGACSLGNFTPRSIPQRRAYERALAYCNGFPHAGPGAGLGLVFWGPTGTGKTHLAAGVLSELVASRGLSGRFWGFATLVGELSRSYDKTTNTAALDPLRAALDVDLLLLDDLGSERIPDWAHNTLFEIVNARYLARRPILITTSFEDVSAEQAAHANPMRRSEYLIDRIGQRVRSRLLEMCAFVPMQEPPPAQEPRSFPPSTLAGMRRRG